MEISPRDAWFADGLAFHCTRCGQCCTGAPGFVWVNDAEIAGMAALRQLPIPEFSERYVRRVGSRRSLKELPGGDCVFYQAKVGCTVYECRPRQCRSWPFWDSNLASPADWDRTCALCPGAGFGEVHSAEMIIERSRMIEI